MKVRATQDGHYAGYYRMGPVTTDQGHFPGEVFEIDDRTFPIMDLESGKPIYELDDQGRKVLGKDGKPKMKMGSWFSPVWMERVADETQTTYDYPPFQIPIQYREVKPRPSPNEPKVLPAPQSVI